MSTTTKTLDVREDIRSGREPFSKIMGTVAQLHPNEDLLLLAPFEPIPLVGVLAKQGFTHNAKRLDSGDWEVVFSRNGAAAPAPAKPVAPENCPGKPAPFVDVDCRGLEPPQPMVKILEALTTLPAGAALRAKTDRRPMHLYAPLEDRGFAGTTEEQNDGSFITIIRSR